MLPVIFAGSALLVLALLKPTWFVLFGFWAVLLSDTLDLLMGHSGGITFVDEVFIGIAAVVLPVRRLLSKENIVPLREWRWLTMFILIGLLSSLIAQAPLLTTALGAVVAVKWFLLAFGIAQVPWGDSEIRLFFKHLIALSLLLTLAGTLNLVFPSRWSSLFSPSGSLDYRFGLPSLIGPFVHPTVFATVMAFLATALLVYRNTVEKTRLTWLLLITTSVGSVLALRRRLWLGLSASLFAVAYRLFARSSTVIWVLALTPILVLLSLDFISMTAGQIALTYFSDSSEFEEARTVLTFDAIEIASSRYGVGIGFGQFGSWVAALIYSPEYTKRGYEFIYGLSPLGSGGANFLTDTFWPSVLAETGWLGTLAFSAVIVTIWRRFARLDVPEAHWSQRTIALVGIGWSAILLVDSVAAPAYFGQMNMFLMLMLGIAAAQSPPSKGVPSAVRDAA